MFDQRSCLFVQQVQAWSSPTLLTSLSHPQSVSCTPLLHRHKSALFDAQFHAVSNAEFQGYTSLRADFNHHPPTKRNRNNSLLFELCAEIVTSVRIGQNPERRRCETPLRTHLHAKHAPVAVIFGAGDTYVRRPENPDARAWRCRRHKCRRHPITVDRAIGVATTYQRLFTYITLLLNL